MSKQAFQTWVNQTLDDHPSAQNRDLSTLHFDQGELGNLIPYLTSLGTLLNFPETALADKVFLRPDLLKTTILDLLRAMPRRQGFFTKKEAEETLETLPTQTNIDEILALMQEFKIAFQIGPKEDQLWTAPLYLPQEAPGGIELLLQVFDRPLRRFTFRHFIHKSIVLEFFQQHIQQIKPQDGLDHGKGYLIWRNGIVLQTPESKELILVRFFMGESTPEYGEVETTIPAHIDVFSFGLPPTGKAPAEDVRNRIKEITKAWRVQEEVTTDGSTFLPLKTLQAASEARETHVFHEGKTHPLEDYAAFIDIPYDRLYISYAEEDEAFCKAFEKHIWPLQQRDKIIVWSKGQLKPGMTIDQTQQQEMQKANIIVLLLSADYFYNRNIWEVELREALARAERGECKLAVIVVRSCDWGSTELGAICHLNHGKVIGDPGNDQAWTNIVEELQKILKPRKENLS